MISCRICREHLPGYISRELSTAARSQVAAHIQTCDACYAVYVQQRNLSSELARTIPALGNPLPRFDRIWAGVEADLRQPKRQPMRLDQARYTMIVLLLMIALLLPWSIRAQQFNLPTPPTPAALNTPATPIAISMAKYTLEVTPQSNHAPIRGATDTP